MSEDKDKSQNQQSYQTSETSSEICHVSPFTRRIIELHDLDSFLSKNHGVCGGHNLGNTCYMNSSIACLSNCSELTAYFLTGKYKYDINKKNKLGLQGKLANSWCDLLDEYWNSKSRTGNPSSVKSTVAKKVSKFGGFGQQDSNEFMTEFLSILNEDLNKSEKKEYLELKEKGKDESELDCAKRFWNLHLQRNDSIITDLFSGLLKSDVVCSECGFDNITFDPFNTLTLAIPNQRYLSELRDTHMEINFYFIPKYCIGNNCRVTIFVPKETQYKDMAEEINKIPKFPHKLNKLIYINVIDSKLKRIIDQEEKKNNKDKFVFLFEDQRKDENTKIVPLYMYKSQEISAFPRLLFLNDDTTLRDLKRQIYYFARNYMNSPFKDNENQKQEINDLDKMIKEIHKKDDEYDDENNKKDIDENKILELLEKEYNQIFEIETNKEKLKEFFNDFPYEITFKKKFEDKSEFKLFNGENILENLKEFNISKDEDSISPLISNKEFCFNLYLKGKSNYILNKFNLNSCESYQNKERARTNITREINLNDLLDYFCSDEHLEKGNEWKCGNCKNRVKITKKFSIFYVPRLLIICIKRFSKSGWRYDKNGIFIDFPIENLDMGKYICGPDKEFSKYDLFAVSQHYGGTGGGHYTAICKNIDGNWYSYNDSSVSHASPRDAVSAAAYVLFYRRKNW